MSATVSPIRYAARRAVRGLYAVTPELDDTGLLLAKVRAALEGGARLVQYRNKRAGGRRFREQASALKLLCTEFGRPLIVNDRLDVALEVDADGAHLGANNGSLTQARRRLGPQRLLGASCYDSLQQAQLALACGADHVAFGSFFPSTVKPDAVAAPLTLLTRARQALDAPIVAIGGISPANAGCLIEAGADAIAVISALFDAPDVRAAATGFAQLFRDPECPGGGPPQRSLS